MRTPSPAKCKPATSSCHRNSLRPLLLANRARTSTSRGTPDAASGIIKPSSSPKYAKRLSITSPRVYKMTKSRRTEVSQNTAVPKIKVTAPSEVSSPSPSSSQRNAVAQVWEPSAQDKIGLVARTPSLSAVRHVLVDIPHNGQRPSDANCASVCSLGAPTPFAQVEMAFEDTMSRITGRTPTLISNDTVNSQITTPTPIPNRPVRQDLRRVARQWDFMPNIPFPNPAAPLNHVRRQIVHRVADDEIGRAL